MPILKWVLIFILQLPVSGLFAQGIPEISFVNLNEVIHRG